MKLSRIEIIIVAVGLVSGIVGFIAGRRVESTRTASEVKTIDKDQSTKKEVKRIEVVSPDGTKRTETVVTDETSNSSSTRQEKKEEVHIAGPKTNISVITAWEMERDWKQLYGLSVNHEVIGPVTVGAWGLTNGTLGVSVGINF